MYVEMELYSQLYTFFYNLIWNQVLKNLVFLLSRKKETKVKIQISLPDVKLKKILQEIPYTV